MNEIASVMRHRREFARAIANRQFEITPAGIHFPAQHCFVGGAFDTEHSRDGELLGRDLSPNIIPTEGLNHLLDVLVHGSTQISPWYIALFEGNVTPAANLTGATFASTCTETTAYNETARVPYNEGAAAAGATDNGANRAVFTMNATKTIYGGAMLSTSPKSDATGLILAASKFSASRAVIAADELAVKYTLTATSS